MTQFNVRTLLSDEWRELRAIRLEAIRAFPGVFGNTLARELERTEDDWRDWLTGDRKCVFGLFDNETMIGLTGIIADRDDPTGQSAIMVASYIRPAYQGQGLSRLLYQARIDWALTQPYLKTIIVGHRNGNESSRRANQAFGFKKTEQKSKVWPDGQTADEILYALNLDDIRRNIPTGPQP